MIKSILFCHDIRHLLKNKNNTHSIVNDSRYPIIKMEEKKKQYTTRDVKRDDLARQFQNITFQPVKWRIHAVDNNILHNLPIMQEDVMMT